MKQLAIIIFFAFFLTAQFALAQCPIDIKSRQVNIFVSNLPDDNSDQNYEPYINITENFMSLLQDRDLWGVRLVNQDIAAIEFITGTNMPTSTTEVGIILTFSKKASNYVCEFNIANVVLNESCSSKKVNISTVPVDENNNTTVRLLLQNALIEQKIFNNPLPETPATTEPEPVVPSAREILTLAEQFFKEGKHKEAAIEYGKVKNEIKDFPKRAYPIYYISKTTDYLDGVFVPADLLAAYLQNSSSEALVKISDELDNKLGGYTLSASNDEYSYQLCVEAQKQGNLRAKYKIGVAMVLGRGTIANVGKGLKTLEEACNNKHEDACAYLVSYYLAKNDCKQAESYLKKLSSTSNKSLRSKYNEVCKGEIASWKTQKISPMMNLRLPEASTCNTSGCNNAQAPKWITYNGSIPANAISGGTDAGQSIYVCRCNYMDGKHSGKVVGGKCLIGWGGKEITVGSFEILTGAKGCSYVWAPWNGSIPSNALIAGYTKYAKIVYVVKGRYNNADVIGKLLKGQTTAFFGYGGVEQVIAPTHVLVSCVSSYKPQLYSYDCPRVDCDGTIVKWETFKGSVSTKAVIGGVENNKNMEICRCDYQNGKHAGKVVAGKCNIGYGGTEVAVSTFEVLEGTLGCNLHWVKWNGKIPDNALVVGTINENGHHNIYAIKTKIVNSEHCGKLREGWEKGSIGYGGKEEWVIPTHILVQCGQ